MTTLLAGLGPAGRGLVTALLASGRLPALCEAGLLVVDPSRTPGGGALSDYDVRSDSAAIVFANCVSDWWHEADVARSAALHEIRSLPDGESVALPVVGDLLSRATVPLIRTLRTFGAEILLGSRLTAVDAHPGGGAAVTLTSIDGAVHSRRATRLVLATGGAPHVPADLAATCQGRLVHSDTVLRMSGVEAALTRLPDDPSVVIVGRAHSAFAVADRLLSSPTADAWAPGSVTVVARGPVRVTYPDVSAAVADGAACAPVDVCPTSGRVWRLAGLRGDAARRYRLARDGLDPRLVVTQVDRREAVEIAATADLVVAATGYDAAAVRLFRSRVSTSPDGSVVDSGGRVLPGIHTIGLGSGSRRSSVAGGEPSYQGPVDGVWHYQNVVAPGLLRDLLATAGHDEAGLLAG